MEEINFWIEKQIIFNFPLFQYFASQYWVNLSDSLQIPHIPLSDGPNSHISLFTYSPFNNPLNFLIFPSQMVAIHWNFIFLFVIARLCSLLLISLNFLTTSLSDGPNSLSS